LLDTATGLFSLPRQVEGEKPDLINEYALGQQVNKIMWSIYSTRHCEHAHTCSNRRRRRRRRRKRRKRKKEEGEEKEEKEGEEKRKRRKEEDANDDDKD